MLRDPARRAAPRRGWIFALLLTAAWSFAHAAACSGSGDDEATTGTPTQTATPSQAARGGDEPRWDAFLLDWGPGRPTVGGALTPLDPLTATTIDEEAIDVGSSFVSVSPDGSRIVVLPVVVPEDAPGVRVLDVADWGEGFTLDEPRGLNPLAWSAGADRVYGVRSAEGGSGERELWVVDLAARRSRMIAQVGYQFESIRVAPDDGRVYVLGYELDGENEAFVDVIDTAGGASLARIALPGIAVGARVPTAGLPEVYAPGWAVAPDGRRLYVASPTDEAIVVVDLEALTVERTVAVRARRGPLERLGGALRDLLAPRAYAHGTNVYEKDVAVSADGSMLYVTGVSDDTCSEEATECLHRRPAGLRAIDAASMTVVAEVEGVGAMAFSPDGKTLYASGYSSDDIAFSRGELVLFGEGLRVLDARTLELRAHFEPDAPYAQVTPGLGGRYVYLLTADPLPRMVVYDASANEAAAERTLEALGPVLLVPGR